MKKKSNAVDTIVDAISIFVESEYEDSAVSEEELAVAKHRFKTALQFIILTTLEEFEDEKKQVQSNASS